MANSFKSNVAANVVTSGNTVYTCPSATQTTIIGLTLSNKGASTVTANVYLTRSAVDYSIISNVPILTGSTSIKKVEETLRWKMTAAQLRVEIWRTLQANNRLIDRSVT